MLFVTLHTWAPTCIASLLVALRRVAHLRSGRPALAHQTARERSVAIARIVCTIRTMGVQYRGRNLSLRVGRRSRVSAALGRMSHACHTLASIGSTLAWETEYLPVAVRLYRQAPETCSRIRPNSPCTLNARLARHHSDRAHTHLVQPGAVRRITPSVRSVQVHPRDRREPDTR